MARTKHTKKFFFFVCSVAAREARLRGYGNVSASYSPESDGRRIDAISGYGAGIVLRALMKGKTAAQIERAFWAVVIAIIGLSIGALLAERLIPPPSPPAARAPATATR